MSHAEYRVIGNRPYRGHQPGTTFEAKLDRPAERRAIQRGDLEILRRFEPALLTGSYTLPDGWAEDASPLDSRDAEASPSLTKGG